MDVKLKNKILEKYTHTNIMADLSKLGKDISNLNEAEIAYYSKNPGHFNNLMIEKRALLVEEPKIIHLKKGDPTRDEKTGITLSIRCIYAILGVKSSFDTSSIDSRRFMTPIWLKYGNTIASGFGFYDLMLNEPLEFDAVYSLVNACIGKWSGGSLIKNEDCTYSIKNNSFDIINK